MRILNTLKSIQSSLLAAVGMILLYQTPKTVIAVQAISPAQGWVGIYEGVTFSLFIEFIIIYFVLNGRRFQAVLSLLGMMIVNYSYYYEAVVSLNPLGLFVMISGPVLIFSITEDVRKGHLVAVKRDSKRDSKRDTRQDNKRDSSQNKKTRALRLLDSGHSVRIVANVVDISKSTVSRWNKEREAA